jgi:putative Holliday junction resolvase
VKQKVLAVDPGDKHIGLAISDELGIIANPLKVLQHVSREKDAQEILKLATEKGVVRIIIGSNYDDDNHLTPQGRKAAKLADTIRGMGFSEIELWDEFESTKTAQKTRLEMGVRRSKRRGHLDELAATIILQTYLDEQKEKGLV